MKFSLFSSLIFAACWVLVSSQSAAAATVESTRQPLLITQIQPESATSGSEELLAIYNPNSNPIDVTGWELQYRSAASQTTGRWTTKATIECLTPAADCTVQLAAKASLVLASYSVKDTTVYPLKSGMALSGGQVRLVQTPEDDTAEPLVEDMVGYGTAVVAEGDHAAPAPEVGIAIVRKQTAAHEFIDTNDNQADFMLNRPVAPPKEPDPSDEEPADEEPQKYLPIYITELLPDPVSPAQDATDEFIELYNPHDVPVDVAGYVLQAGSDWRYAFTLRDITIPAKGYVVLSAEQTGILLSNSGSSVRLLDPDGSQVDTITPYAKAEPGLSWMKDSAGGWHWSKTVTPGAANILTAPAVELKAATAKKAATPKATATKKPATAKTVSAAKPKQPTNKAAKQPAETATQQLADAKPTNYWLIWSVAALAGGYMAYEYRSDALRSMRKLRERIKSK